MTTRPRRTALVFALLALAAVTMLAFEATITRLIGVLALFGFIVAGAFAIAEPGFLTADGDSAHDEGAAAGNRRAQER
jgi:hypothetical protein